MSKSTTEISAFFVDNYFKYTTGDKKTPSFTTKKKTKIINLLELYSKEYFPKESSYIIDFILSANPRVFENLHILDDFSAFEEWEQSINSIFSTQETNIGFITALRFVFEDKFPKELNARLDEDHRLKGAYREFRKYLDLSENFSFGHFSAMKGNNSTSKFRDHPEFKNIVATTEKAIKQIEDYAKKVTEKLDGETEQLNGLIGQFETDIEQRIKDAAQAVSASIKMQDAFKLWENKAKSHRQLFHIGCCLFILLIGVFCIGTWYNWNGIITTVSLGAVDADGNPIQMGAQMLSRVVLISLPFGIAIWLLRAVLRWANLNLSLAEDATQRVVLSQTFINLMSEGAVKEDQDRQIMLTALFRPLPGVKDLDIAPTTIKDIVDPKKSK